MIFKNWASPNMYTYLLGLVLTCKSAADKVAPTSCPPISDSICEFHMIVMRSVRCSAYKRRHVLKGLAFKSLGSRLQNCWPMYYMTECMAQVHTVWKNPINHKKSAL